jgi:peptidoglycan/xylan/chitin deacetylase (PgdA/CDA1 family)
MDHGKFVISLDFELMWGVRDKKTIEGYGPNILGVHQMMPTLLNIFHRFEINATFATVGLLFFENKSQIITHLPDRKPGYRNKNLSPYNGYLEAIGESAKKDLYHYAPLLLAQILEYPNHEISSHTFSHYYCLEEGQTIEDFREDLRAATKAAEKLNIKIRSLVFPRNQFNNEYLKVCKEMGIICYRGNEHSWMYKAINSEKENLLRRGMRLADAYINFSGHNCYSDEELKRKDPIDIPASRFLRPYSKKARPGDSLRLKRIKSGMTHAAKMNKTFHLWWHPHNFGINQSENFDFLEKILKHFGMLKTKYNFQSITMSQLATKLNEEKLT